MIDDSPSQSASTCGPGSSRRRIWWLGLGLWAVTLVLIGLPLALGRHFQVDEYQNAYQARLLVSSGSTEFLTSPKPFMVLLGYLSLPLETTEPILLTFRVIFFMLFVANFLLLGFGQPYFTTGPGRLATLAAAFTLFPLWKFGFEIRHDVLLLTGNLALYALSQRAVTSGLGRRGLLAGGIAVMWTILAAHKGFAYALPFGMVLVAASSADSWWQPRVALVRAGAFVLLGASVALLAAILLLSVSGTLDTTWEGVVRFGERLDGARTFPGWPTLKAAIFESPLVFGLAAAFVVLLAADLARSKPRLALTPTRVTGVFFLWSLVVFFSNPQTYRYNILHVLPFAFFAGLDVINRVRLSDRRSGLVFAGALLCPALVMWIEWRLNDSYNQTNDYQQSYISAAEAMTAPDETVLDGVGFVLTRMPPDPHWQLHSSFMRDYRKGRRTSFSDIMRKGGSPVIITNYRWRWLPRRDKVTRSRMYVQIGKYFWVLGSKLSKPTGEFQIYRRGRYFVKPHKADSLGALTIDDSAIPGNGIKFLDEGEHRYAAAPKGGIVVHWLGPTLDKTPILKSPPTRRILRPL
jgi:hypothetical protein